MLIHIKNINPIQTDKYPFAEESITDIEGNIRKVVQETYLIFNSKNQVIRIVSVATTP
jgi:hypothetical protein